jgi:hypothetical protein
MMPPFGRRGVTRTNVARRGCVRIWTHESSFRRGYVRPGYVRPAQRWVTSFRSLLHTLHQWMLSLE